MKHLKKFNENDTLPREFQIKSIAGALNSYQHISMTDDRMTFDFHMKEQDNIEKKLKGITCKELYELYFMLNENGIKNLTKLFSFVFNDLEKEHNSNPVLNIWDLRQIKKLYFKMRHLKRFNESLEKSFPGEISISDFIDRLNEGRTPPLGASKETIISWWSQNRSNFKIHYFPFNTQKPIMGCFVGTDRVLINSTPPVPGDIKFFIALHESRHAFQEENGEFTPKYFQTVVDGNKEEFLQNYKELEDDANTYAIDSCRTMGFTQIVNMERMLRSNENMGEEIYRMMTDDLAKTNASTFFELLEGQIL